MHRGWFKCWRKIVDSRVFANEGLLKVWIWCLASANHSTEWVPVTFGRSTQEVEVGAGQFIFGRHSAAKALRMKPETVRSRMKKLENLENLTMQSTTHYTLVTITNWPTYAASEELVHQPEHQGDTKATPRRHQGDTTNKNKENKENKKKQTRSRFAPPSVEEVAAYCDERTNGIDAQAFIDWYAARGWKHKGGVKMTDWKAAVRTWEGRRKEEKSRARTVGQNPGRIREVDWSQVEYNNPSPDEGRPPEEAS